MDSRTMINIYKWASYILIAGATAVFFLTKKPDLTLVLLTMAAQEPVPLRRKTTS